MADEYIVKIEDPIYIQAVSSVDPLLVYLRGYNAYEVAVQAGFEGTREEWLASLAEEATLICEGYRDEAQTARDELDPVLINIATLLAIGEKLSEVETAAGDLTNIDTVAGEIDDVNTVATNIADVNLAAENIVAIQAAPTYAEEAEKWAENPEDSPVETGKYSAKHWAAKAEDVVDEAYAVVENKIDKTAVKQEIGASPTDVMSQKAVTDELAQLAGEVNQMVDESARLEQESIDRTFKTMRIGASGLVTLSPTTRYFTYRLNVMNNITLSIDLQRMIEQVGNARCRLIIDMPIVKTITITNPILWGGTAPTFAAAGQYIFEIIDVDGSGTPLVWLVASTTKQQATGNILYVDSTGASYSSADINGEVATRTTSSWANPFKYLQNAINDSEAGDIIFVKAGVYKPTHLRTSPELYTDGDHLLRDSTFSPKDSVDMYGGFVGTESKTWEREVDENGYPVNATILCGDILNEAVIDPAKTVGDPRTDLSKANAAYNVVMAQERVTNITYLNGFEIRYGNANGSTSNVNNTGGGINARSSKLVGITNRAYSNTASSGGGWRDGTNTNCTAYSNTASSNGGGWRDGTNTNCTAYSNTASSNGGGWYSGTNTNCTAYSNTASSNGGGWYSGTNTNCTAYSNTATNGGGWRDGTNTNCTAYSNTASSGGGWRDGTNTNCTAYSNTASYGGGWYDGMSTNCTAYSNTASSGGGWRDGTNTNCTAYSNTASSGGGWYDGMSTNCTGVNNKAPQAVFGAPSTDTNINCLLYNNKTAAGVATGFDNKTATGVKIFRNNAYDVAHPTITGGAGSDINTATCIQNLTAEQVKIEVPTFIGAAETPEQLSELHDYAATIATKLKPKAGSVLKGAGVNNTTYPNPTDFEGVERPENSTIGILEGE